jgi:hypothetical protein
MRRSDENETVDALVLISFPHQILHALAAINFDSDEIRAATPSTKAFFLWSHQPANHRAGSSFSNFAVRALSREGKVILPGYLSRLTAYSPYRTIRARASSAAALSPKARTFYFSHDQSADHTAQAFLQSGIAQRSVCFGDPPGFFYPPEWSPPWNGEGTAPTLKNALWRTRLRGLESWSAPDALYAAIPSGHHAEAVRRIPRSYFIDALQTLNARLPEIAAATSTLALERSLLLITSNFYESGFMSRENECRLYAEIARASIEHGETLVIRPHPGATDASIRMLANELSSMPVRFFPDALRHYPVELFAHTFQGSRISSVSSSSLMLRFLYNIRVECSLTENRVERFFKPEYHEYGRAMVRAFRLQAVVGAAL